MNTPDQARHLRLTLSLAQLATRQHNLFLEFVIIREMRRELALKKARGKSRLMAAVCRIDEHRRYRSVQGS